MNEKFNYKPLDTSDNEIRLVEINKHGTADRLDCTLVHCSLDKDPSYIALSYAWQDLTLVPDNGLPVAESIQLNDQTFEVGNNLAKALDHLQYHHSARVWIDAICINQDDMDERGEQVLRMGSIYTQAESVLIWLGREAYDSNGAVDLIETIAGFDDTVHASRWILESVEDETQVLAWKAVHHLFERSWWTRVWIRQEAALAKEVKFAIGERTMSWDHLERFIVNLSAVFHALAQRLLQRHGLEINHKSLNSLMTLQNLRKARLSGDALQYGILNNLIMTLHSRCSDDRDRLYGIIGLSSDAVIEKPDYRLSASEIFIQFTRSYIQASNSLDIMLIDTQPRVSMNLPTWVPDWGSEATGRISLSNTWSHAAPYSNSITFSKNSRVLSCQGVLLDRVDGIAYDFSTPRTDTLGAVVLPKHSSNAYKTHNEAFQALWEAILTDKSRYDGGESQAPREFGCIFLERCREADHLLDAILNKELIQPFRPGSSEFEKWYQRNWNFTFAGKTLRSWALDTTLGSDIKRSVGEDANAARDSFEATCVHMAYKRRLITTRDGYIAHAPRDIKPGDEIWVLPACKVPVILRKAGENHHLIGECYVHGVMNEEAFHMGREISTVNIT